MKMRIGLWMVMVLLAAGALCGEEAKPTIARLDEGGRYLEVAPHPMSRGDGNNPVTRQTKGGERILRWVHGRAEYVFGHMHQENHWKSRNVNLGPNRVVVEGGPCCSVVYDRNDKMAFRDVATQLGMEVVVEKRKVDAWVLGPIDKSPLIELEPYQGKPKWDFPKEDPLSHSSEMSGELYQGLFDGTVYKKNGLYYFDGITMDELARFIEEENQTPVVNKTGKKGRYSFTLPQYFWKKILFKGETDILKPIGIKVSWSEKEPVEVVVVRDAPEGVKIERPLPVVEVEDPPVRNERISELVGSWRIKKVVPFGQSIPGAGELDIFQIYLGFYMRYDGHRFYRADRSRQEVSPDLACLEFWTVTRWGKFYRVTQFDLVGGQWKPENRILLRLDGDTLHWCGWEDCGLDEEESFPKDFSDEQTAQGIYMVLDRVKETSEKLKAKPPTRQRRMRVFGRRLLQRTRR